MYYENINQIVNLIIDVIVKSNFSIFMIEVYDERYFRLFLKQDDIIQGYSFEFFTKWFSETFSFLKVKYDSCLQSNQSQLAILKDIEDSLFLLYSNGKLEQNLFDFYFNNTGKK